MTSPVARTSSFCSRFGVDVPVLLAPMAGACPPSLSIAVANAGGMGAAGMLLHEPRAIASWMQEFRAGSTGAVQLNLWVPDRPPVRDAARERAVREFLGAWGPPVPAEAGDAKLHDFDYAVVLGHRGYYPRFGFVPASRFGLSFGASVPDDVFMALELRTGALSAVARDVDARGPVVVRYLPAFG